VVGDAFRQRERNFGRVHSAEGAVLAPGEPRHSTRIVGNYPGNPGSRPVTARYSVVKYVDASSSMAFTDSFGEVRPENAPFAAVDGDRSSAWRSGFLEDPVGQWLDLRLKRPQEIGVLRVLTTVANPVVGEITRLQADAGGATRRAEVDPFTGKVELDLTGVTSDRVKLTVLAVNKERGDAPVSIQDVDIDGPAAERTLVVPTTETAPEAAYVFTAQPEVRACITTLLAPDCSFGRGRMADESAGIDRTFEVGSGERVRLTGTVIARPRQAAQRLLDPIGGPVVIRASSTLASDPTVSARMGYDGSGSTSWIADPFDPTPTLTVEFAKPRTISRIGVAQPAQPAVTPTQAVLRSGNEERVVDLGDFGAFEPLRTSRLTITFRNPTRGLSPIGLSELYLGPKGVTLPFDGATETGALCGFGPVVELDGTRYDTAVDGFMGNVVSAGPLDLALCDDEGIAVGELDLTPGEHRLRVISTEEFQPVVVALRPTAPQPAAEPARELKVLSDEASEQRLTLGSGEASILRTTRNYNTGWVAELDGEPLPVQRVDGWAQGWRVPAGEGGSLVIRYAPEKSYVVLLFTGLAVALGILAFALLLLVRTRLAPERPLPPAPPRGRRRRTAAGLLVVAGLPAWLLGGVPAAAGLVLAAGFVLLGRRGPALWLATLLLAAGPVVVAVSQHLGDGSDRPVVDLLSGTGLLLAVGSILVVSRRDGETAST
jgi:arabinofuranan 3-O-arabinosyltransferase